jgi:glycerophosphoryl diester phosphodiesterase
VSRRPSTPAPEPAPGAALGSKGTPALRRVGHKGADAIVPGNTIASFQAAVAAGVEMIELDVLWLRDGHPRLPPSERTPLVVAHDWRDAAARDPLTLGQVLDAFTRPPLDSVELDCDLKLRGREDELVAALRERELLDRAMVSTMELSSLAAMRELEPRLRLGWTYPRVTRDWDRRRWARPGVISAMLVMRRRLPALARRRLPELGVASMWIYHPLVSARLAAACREAGVELIAWTVDEPARMRALLALGIDGICTNDPRLFAEL